MKQRSTLLSDAEVWELRLISEIIARPLADLWERDRWLGARFGLWLKQSAHTIFGPRHTAWKLIVLAFFVALSAATMLPWHYRLDATVTIRSKDLLFMPAPFDGYLRVVHVDIGDAVNQEQILVELDTHDLRLEESMAQADLVRYTREMEKAQATRQLADMQIALARQQQSAAKLDLIRYQLAHAQVRAPYTGTVIEGELKKRLGAPVRKGDLLLKLAHSGETEVELEIDQADIHDIRLGSRGEFALVGRPEERFTLTINRIDPIAVNRNHRNLYVARAEVDIPLQPWWRPGMGGTAKLDAGEHSLLWVLTRRTVRFIRELFWI